MQTEASTPVVLPQLHEPGRPLFAQSQSGLLDELLVRSQAAERFVLALAALPVSTLLRRPRPGAWNALECLAHLNDYADLYLDQLDQRRAGMQTRRSEAYRSGMLGGYMARMLHPANRTTKRMRSPKKTNHLDDHRLDRKHVLQEAQQNARRYAALVDEVHTSKSELRGSRIPFSALPGLIKFHYGDLITMLIWHQDRHLHQAAEAVA